MAKTANLISSRVEIKRRYVRSVDLARDADNPEALDGYVITPSVRDTATRILAGLSPESWQRAFRIVGPYGAGKSAFGVFLVNLLRERGNGPATKLLSKATDRSFDVTPWRPIIVSGRRVSFAREILRVVAGECGECSAALANLKMDAESILNRNDALDVYAVSALIAELATELRAQTGEGLLLLIDEMGHFLEYGAIHIGKEDPSIFQNLAERAGGRAGANLGIVGILHHRFVDHVVGMGEWVEAEWSRYSERYEELSFGCSTEQSLFMLSHTLEPAKPHSVAVRRYAEELYGQAVDFGLFAAPRKDIVKIASKLYPLHPATVAALALGIRRFGQNERSLFGFLQSLEPAGFQRFAYATPYGAKQWYLAPMVFDHLAATINENPQDSRMRRWTLAFDTLATASDLTEFHQNILKTIALVAVLEPLPGLVADVKTIAWSLGSNETGVQQVLNQLAERSLIYRRPHRDDYSLWANSSVDLSRWLDEAKTKVRTPERIEEVQPLLNPSRPAVAHRHYHETGTLRTFEVQLWNGENVGMRSSDGLILVVPIYPGDDWKKIPRKAVNAAECDPLALVCTRIVEPDDLKWAHELALWNWVRENCEELRVDELARTEVNERIAVAEHVITNATSLLSSADGSRKEKWWLTGKPIDMPQEGLSALLSDICNKVYDQAPVLKNELINRTKLSHAVTSARTRLLENMLNYADRRDLGMEGTPPERTIYLSLFQASRIHRKFKHGGYSFGIPNPKDPCRWRPVWDRIAELLDSDEAVSFTTLFEELAAPPYGLRPSPALLAITAFVLASKDSIAIMERNSFQPDLTVAHFMRLAKAPFNFALIYLREDSMQGYLMHALSTNIHVIGSCQPTLGGISEKLFAWYNSLPPFALKTTKLSNTAIAVRDVLRKATEPRRLFIKDLPTACGCMAEDGSVDLKLFVEILNMALLELQDAMSLIKSKAIESTLQAFDAQDLPTLRSQIHSDYEPYLLNLSDYRMRVFVDRAMNTEFSKDQWLNGIAGHITGKRLENWEDNTLEKFDFEIRNLAENLTKWLALVSIRQAHRDDWRSVHVVGIDGREQVVVVRRDRPNPHLTKQLSAVRKVLGNDPQAIQVLGQLLAEYAEIQVEWINEKEVDET